MPSRPSARKEISPNWHKVEAEALGINPDGMAQVPATQQPQPVLSHGAFFTGVCFCVGADAAGMGMTGIMEHGIEPAAFPVPAQTGAALARQKPRATSRAVIRRPKKRGMR